MSLGLVKQRDDFGHAWLLQLKTPFEILQFIQYSYVMAKLNVLVGQEEEVNKINKYIT